MSEGKKWIPEGTDMGTQSDLYLSQQKKTFVPAGKLTFADRSIGELTEIMEKAESEFQEYPSFYGFAIHYYESFQKLFKKKAITDIKVDTSLSFFSFLLLHGKTSLWTRQ